MTTRHPRLLLTVALLSGLPGGTVGAQEAVKPPPKPQAAKAGDTVTEASCLLKITLDPQVLPLSAQSVQFLMSSSGVAREAAREVLGEQADGVKVTFETLSVLSGPGSAGAAVGYGGYTFGASPMMPGESADVAGVPAAPSGTGDPAASDGSAVQGEAGRFTGVFTASGGLPNVGLLPFYVQEQVILGRLTVNSPHGRAREVMNGVTKRFQATIAEACESEQRRFDERRAIAEKQVVEARARLKQLHDLRQKLLDSSSLTDLSRPAILEMSRRLEMERQDTAIKRETLRARQEAMRVRIKELADAAAKTSEETARDQQTFQDRIRVLRQTLDDLRDKQGNARTDSEKAQVLRQMRDIEMAMTQAQAEMAARREQGGAGPAAKQLAAANEQLAALSVDLTESEMRLAILEKQCEQMRSLLGKADEFELQVGLELPLAKASYENARRRQEELNLRRDAFRPPSVTILGG